MPLQRGRTPFERLRHRFEATAVRCPGCGYEEEGGDWHVVARGRRVRYEYTCPTCGERERREVTLPTR